MRTTSRIFTILFVFFLIVGAVYGFVTAQWMPMGLEPVGFAAILMLAGMAAMIAAVLAMNAKRFSDRPEDIEDAPVSADAGIQGSFAPYSWWPLFAAIGGAMAFLGVAAGWWILALGMVPTLIGVIGWVMEFSVGKYRH